MPIFPPRRGNENLVFGLRPRAALYYLVAIYCAWQFFSPRDENHDDFAPPVNILKPIRGLDREAYENFASFCRQNYPRYEMPFGVANDQDPAMPAIREVIRDFPKRAILPSRAWLILALNSRRVWPWLGLSVCGVCETRCYRGDYGWCRSAMR